MKLNAGLRNAVKSSEKIISFLNSLICIGCSKFSLLPGKYFSSGVNVLTNGVKISDIAKKEYLQMKFFRSGEKTW